MRFLPIKLHNVLDFVVGLVLVLAPNIFSFSDVGGAAVWVPRIIGIVAIISGFTTRGWPFSFTGIFTPKIHVWMDTLAGVVLAVSPWLFGFSDEKSNAWVPHLVVGIALILVGLTTRTDVAGTRAAEAKV